MDAAHAKARSGIARHGFARWYERQLFEAFAWLTTCLLSGVVIAAILELVGLHTPGMTPLITLVVLYLVGLMGFESWRRFWSQLTRAQHYANQATCPECDANGLFEVADDARSFAIRCRRCGHQRTIE